MAITVQFPKSAKDYLGDGSLNLNTADLRAIPLNAINAYTLDHTDVFVADIASIGSIEVTTNGGSRVALTTKTWALSGNNGRYDCDDIAWTASGGTLSIGQVVIADYTGSTGDSDREFVALLTFDALASAGVGTQVKVLTPNGLWDIQ